MPREAVVTGLGAVSSLGRGCDSLWAAVEAGRDGMRPIERFSTEGFGVHLAALVPGLDGEAGTEHLCTSLAIEAAREAWDQAGVGSSGIPPERIGLVMGTSVGDGSLQPHGLAERVAHSLSIKGPVITISTACASSANALGAALDLLHGDADLVVAGGVDVLTPEVFAGFHALSVLSPEKCAPFSRPPGTTLGEGAGFAVLEPGVSARTRGAKPLAAVLGYGLSCDAFHETSPDPTGKGVARCMLSALRDAGLQPEDIGYINAHGTGTDGNDPSEWRGIVRVFKERSDRIPVSSSKSFLGHAQGAAGALEAIITILAMNRGVVPPTLHYKGPRPFSPPDPVASEKPRSLSYDHALCLNSAFGGANAAIVVSREGAGNRKPARHRVGIFGAGVVGPHGTDLCALSSVMEDGSIPGPAPVIEIDRLVPTADPRGLDPATVNLTAAAVLAIRDADLIVRGDLRDRTGIIVGMTRSSPSSLKAFEDSIRRRGLSRVSSGAFSRIVLNAAAGTCAKILSLRGPTSTLSTGPGSGLAAVIYAAMLLSGRTDVDFIIAGGVDEPENEERERGHCDEAACLVLGSAPEDMIPAARLAGWGLAGPGRSEDAARLALDMAGMQRHDMAAVIRADDGANGASRAGKAEASQAATVCAATFVSLRGSGSGPVLVLENGSRSLSAALIITGGQDGC